MLVYPSGVDVQFPASPPRAAVPAAPRTIGSLWRRLSAGRQALLTFAHLRRGHTCAQLAAGFNIGTTTAHRYVTEAVELLAALAPSLADAVRIASAKAYLILDGTLVPTDRIAADRPFDSGKHRKHGMNVQVLADPFGRLLWASPALPGAVHDIRAAREHGIIDALTEADIPCWADKAYRGAGGTVRIPCWGRWEALSACQQAVNRSHARIRPLSSPPAGTAPTTRPAPVAPRDPPCSDQRTITPEEATSQDWQLASFQRWR